MLFQLADGNIPKIFQNQLALLPHSIIKLHCTESGCWRKPGQDRSPGMTPFINFPIANIAICAHSHFCNTVEVVPCQICIYSWLFCPYYPLAMACILAFLVQFLSLGILHQSLTLAYLIDLTLTVPCVNPKLPLFWVHYSTVLHFILIQIFWLCCCHSHTEMKQSLGAWFFEAAGRSLIFCRNGLHVSTFLWWKVQGLLYGLTSKTSFTLGQVYIFKQV